jgi:hypothetical protein
MLPTCSDWHELPHREIWCLDTEFYPGAGLAHGGRDGDLITPLCLVAHEMRSGRTVSRWQDELGPFPPYRLDDEALLISYMFTAEAGFHQACGWGQPARAIDAYIEFRHLTNDARVKAGDRPKGYYSLDGALRHFRLDAIDVAHKEEMRDRILQGPPFSSAERELILSYCEDDCRALSRLVPCLIPTIPSLRHALFRAQYAWALARVERRGPPIDLIKFERLKDYWEAIKVDLVAAVDKSYDCYEIVDGEAHWRDEKFLVYTQRAGISWPRHPSGKPDLSRETFKEAARIHPCLAELRELRNILAHLRRNELAVGRDGRNRPSPLGPFGTKTGRNGTSSSRSIFGPSKALRGLIAPPPGRALIHRDYQQQEVRIAATKSGDLELQKACEGDVYLGVAAALGFDLTRSGLRDLFKVVLLSIQYGAGAHSLAERADISLHEAGEILARVRARFHVFEDWIRSVDDYAGLNLMMSTSHGWRMHCPPGTNPRTIRNFPMQATGAAILHTAIVLAERRNLFVVAPIHDALIAEADVKDAAEMSRALDRLMRDAAAVVLGQELPTDDGGGPILPGQRFRDKRGEAMWLRINGLIDALERRRA